MRDAERYALEDGVSFTNPAGSGLSSGISSTGALLGRLVCNCVTVYDPLPPSAFLAPAYRLPAIRVQSLHSTMWHHCAAVSEAAWCVSTRSILRWLFCWQ